MEKGICPTPGVVPDEIGSRSITSTRTIDVMDADRASMTLRNQKPSVTLLRPCAIEQSFGMVDNFIEGDFFGATAASRHAG
jgi:hypothetical protein